MIYHIQGNDTVRIREILKELQGKLNIGRLRVIENCDFDKPTIQKMLNTAEYLNIKTGGVIIITEKIHLIDIPNYKTMVVDTLPLLVGVIDEVPVDKLVNRFIS